MSKKKTTEDKNLDLQIDYAINDTRHALCECVKWGVKCHVRTCEAVPFMAHAAVPYACSMLTLPQSFASPNLRAGLPVCRLGDERRGGNVKDCGIVCRKVGNTVENLANGQIL